jgi:hypothetical protein
MLENRYDGRFDADLRTFRFISEGPNGRIKKVVHYVRIYPNFYNLGFGDLNILTNEIDDRVITNNGDSQKVLITVAYTLFVFTDHYPRAFVVAAGSLPARTRLYRMGISNNLEIIENDFYVLGQKGDYWYPFEKNVDYDAFLVKRKRRKFGR